MVIPIENIDVSHDSKRFDELLRQGALPSVALKIIHDENLEKKLNPPKPGFFGKVAESVKANYPFTIIGLLGTAIIMKYVISPSTTTKKLYKLSPMLEDINGIDLELLSECRNKGLM